MKLALATVLLLSFLAPGCATQRKARQQLDAAFQAGQRQSLQQLYDARFPVVTVQGPVLNSTLDWTEDLTVAQAIVAAGYRAAAEPQVIILHRGRNQYRISPQQLLAGEDWLLAPGDRLEILP